MYFIKWIENGKEKSYLAEGYIELWAMTEKLEEKNITFSTKAL